MRTLNRTRAVTMVTPGFSPSTGGVEAHTTALATELARRGFDVEVLTARRGVTRPEVTEHLGCRVVTYPAWSVSSMSVSPRLFMAAIRRRNSNRVMHVHSYHATTTMALAGRRAPTVFTPHYHGRHGHSALADILHRGYYWLARLLMRRTDAVICVSDAEREQLQNDFPSARGRTMVIPNGVAASAIRAAVPYPKQPKTVLMVGRLEAYKRFDAVITAFAEVAEPAQLVVVGEGAERDELEKLAAQLGIAHRVRLVGAVTDQTLHRWFATASVFVSMSQREAFGMAPLEAASAGCRVVLSDIPAHREIIERYLDEGVIVAPDAEPATLASEIARQLCRPPATATRIPEWQDIASTTANLYNVVSRPFDFYRTAPRSSSPTHSTHY